MVIAAHPDDPETADSYQRTKDRAVLIVAEVLGRSGEERWRYLQERHAHMWVIDKED